MEIYYNPVYYLSDLDSTDSSSVRSDDSIESEESDNELQERMDELIERLEYIREDGEYTSIKDIFDNIDYSQFNYRFWLKAAEINGYCLEFVPQELRTKEVCLAAVSQNAFVLKHVPRPLYEDDTICLAAVRNLANDGGIDDEDTILKAFKNLGIPLKHEYIIEAVSLWGYNLKDLDEDEQTVEYCEIAVNEDEDALEYAFKQTDEMCLKAVRKKHWLLEYVKHQTGEIIQAAVDQNIKSLYLIRDKSIDVLTMMDELGMLDKTYDTWKP